MPGTLYIVGTPIGNMDDITLRALRALREADIIAAEDTRRTAQLLARHGLELSGRRETPKTASWRSHPTIHDSESAPITNPQSPVSRRLLSYHEFNEAKRTQELLKELQQGRSVALVTDAGMPTISDPGQRLIQAVVEWNAQFPGGVAAGLPPEQRGGVSSRSGGFRLTPASGAIDVASGSGSRGKDAPMKGAATGETTSKISIEIIPGPSAVTMAMAISGFLSENCRARRPEGFRAALPCRTIDGANPRQASGPSRPTIPGASHKAQSPMPTAPSAFLFFGFLPHKSTQRRKALAGLAPLPYTLVFFESPYRLVKCLQDMQELLGNRQAVIARELTKKFEEILRGDLATILKKLENRTVKGEITVVVEGQQE